MMDRKAFAFIAVICSPIMGFLSAFLPVVLFRGEESLFEGVHFYGLPSVTFDNLVFIPTVVLLFIVGCVLGYVGSRIWWLTGILTVIVFPVFAIYEMNVSPTSHNLWPLEFALYGIGCIPAVIGAFIGSRLYLRSSRSS